MPISFDAAHADPTAAWGWIRSLAANSRKDLAAVSCRQLLARANRLRRADAHAYHVFTRFSVARDALVRGLLCAAATRRARPGPCAVRREDQHAASRKHVSNRARGHTLRAAAQPAVRRRVRRHYRSADARANWRGARRRTPRIERARAYRCKVGCERRRGAWRSKVERRVVL